MADLNLEPLHSEKFLKLLTKYVERILNKIAKTFNKTYAGLKSMLQRFGMYFAQKPRFKSVKSTS